MSTIWVECWKCDECGHRWIKTELWPERCASSKCRKRSWNKNQVAAALVRQEPKEAPRPQAAPPPPAAAAQMNDAMARFMAKLPAAPIVEAEAQEERSMCSYREYDPETGETYACGLREHPGKVRHTRGAAV